MDMKANTKDQNADQPYTVSQRSCKSARVIFFFQQCELPQEVSMPAIFL